MQRPRPHVPAPRLLLTAAALALAPLADAATYSLDLNGAAEGSGAPCVLSSGGNGPASRSMEALFRPTSATTVII